MNLSLMPNQNDLGRGWHLNTGGTSAKSSSMVALRVGEGSAKVETSAGVNTDPEAVHNTGAQHFVLFNSSN